MKDSKALSGVRVLDFTWSVAGPTMTRNLAALGAEVIKVEWPERPDPMRTAMYAAEEQRKGLDNGAFFSNLNIGKKSLTLDVRSPEGFDILCDLLKHCDVIAESFSSRVFESWGLTFDRLSRLHPGIIYISLSGFGHSGRYAANDTWGPTAQAFNGLTFMSGLPGEAPAGWGWSFMDLVGGYMGTIATLMAVYHNKQTGEGQHIDMSQIESGIPLNGASLLDYAANDRETSRPGFPPGNRSIWPGVYTTGYRGEMGAPYNAYPTKGGGPNDYCVVSVLSEDQWKRLRDALDNPYWAEDPKFATSTGRIAAQEELDQHIAAWTAQRDKYDVMEHLQSHGIPSGVVQSAEDRMEHDPQLRHRNLFPSLDHPQLGSHRFEGMPFHMSATEPELEPRWPLIGKDNAYVLGELLGCSQSQIEDLEANHITWPKGMPKDVVFEKSLW